LGLGCTSQCRAKEKHSCGKLELGSSEKWLHTGCLVLFRELDLCRVKKVTQAHMWAIWTAAVDFFEANIVQNGNTKR